jgi:hypothetical protein
VGRRIVSRALIGLALLSPVATNAPPLAIETDQYYAWGRPLADATDMVNAKFNLEVDRVLAEVNAKSSWRRKSCAKVREAIVGHFRLFIFHDLELWCNNTKLIERIPATAEEELEYRKRYLYHNRGKLDVVTMVPPSPTIELNGVRFGTDKLTHFLSQGWWYYGWYAKGLRKGMSNEQAERKAIDRGIFTERTVLGKASSGVLSIPDLEANYRGMRFLWEMCEGDAPYLQRGEDGWRFDRPFDFRDHVTPEWDESYVPSIYTKRRWKRVQPVLVQYCPQLQSSFVQERWATYRAHDVETPTEKRVRELVEADELPDPEQFSIERLCGSR